MPSPVTPCSTCPSAHAPRWCKTARAGRLVLATRHAVRLASNLLVGLLTVGAMTPAGAEKADRTKPFLIESDIAAKVDLRRQLLVYTGNVVVVQGTMQLRADRIEMGKTPDDNRTASAHGTAAKPATWRQKRDGVDETVEGSADRIEFDAKSDTLTLTGRAVVRRLRGATVADEISGAHILWDNSAEVFKVDSGSSASAAGAAANPGGRVRAVLTPKAQPSGPNATTPATAAPTSAPTTPAPELAPSRSLGDRR